MAAVGLVVALVLLWKVRAHLLALSAARPEPAEGSHRADAERAASARCGSWHEAWHRAWADKFRREAERRQHDAARWARHCERARRRGRGDRNATLGFYLHLMSYLGVVGFLALINLLTTAYPWFVWPALGWGLGVFSHYVGVFGTALFRRRWLDPAVAREVRREKLVLTTEKQASIDELSSTLAHEIRNPIAAAKSLVQQIGEDPASLQTVEYARVAVEELDRVERSIAHLLKYAREEDYHLAPTDLAAVVDAALTELRAKLDAARVAVSRNYVGGPTVIADRDKLRRVFSNVVDNAIDALGATAGERRIECFVQNGGERATVRIRDNGGGIPADKLDRIFNPFFTTKPTGTGLGMAISKKIVEAHEGTIDVISEPGHGAEFVVALPMPR